MNSSFQNALIFVIYGAALAGTVALGHIGWMDSQLEAGLIGAIVTHMGLNYAPSNTPFIGGALSASEVKKTV